MFDRFKNSFWFFQIGGWLVYYAVIYITFLSVAAEGNFLRLFYIKGFRTIGGFLLTCALWQFYKRIFSRFAISFIISTALLSSVLFGIIWTVIENIFSWQTSASYDFYDSLARSPRTVLDYAMTLTAWSAIYFGAKYQRKWQTESENALQSAALAQKAQLEMLRYQLNPHFLFNALNSIRASIDEDAARAKRMITQLSEFLRYSLLGAGEKKISLRDEIEAVRNYLAIEKIRFEDKLTVEFEIEPAAEDFRVPPFLLNPLVENAVKHGLQTSSKPLKIKISAAVFDGGLILEVANSGRLQNGFDSNGTKIGLKNVRERLEKLFGDRGQFELKEENDFVKARIEITKLVN